ncbi:MAG: methyltransferase, TIGR04325 family [bacterium]|nr:methyltransferase, TIGR04325 family [bacterium]
MKKFIPSALLRWLAPDNSRGLEYEPRGWRIPHSDYNEESILKKQIQKYERLLNRKKFYFTREEALEDHELTSAQLVALRAAWNKDNLQVLDFGGSLGIYYHFIKKVLPSTVRLDYHISEVPKICETGKKINPQVHFHELNLPPGRFDLVMANGALQYIPDWKNLLKQFASADYLYLPRMPMTNGATFTVKDFYAGIASPLIFEVRNVQEVKDFIQSLNFRLVQEFVFAPFPPVKNAPLPIFYTNWLFKK